MSTRIDPGLLIPDGEAAEPFTWVRSPMWQGKSHLMLANGVDAPCGAFQPSDPAWYRAMSYAIARSGGKEPVEWFRAYESRKGGKCGQCKTREKTLDKTTPAPVSSGGTAQRWAAPKSRREGFEQMKLHQQAVWVSRLLGGAEITEETHG